MHWRIDNRLSCWFQTFIPSSWIAHRNFCIHQFTFWVHSCWKGSAGVRWDRWRGWTKPGQTPNQSHNNKKTRQGTETQQNSISGTSAFWKVSSCCSHVDICHMTIATGASRPGNHAFVSSSVWLVDVVNMDLQMCAVDCWAVIGQLDSFGGSEGNKSLAVHFLESPSSSPVGLATVPHFTAEVQFFALSHKHRSTTCSNRWTQLTFFYYTQKCQKCEGPPVNFFHPL